MEILDEDDFYPMDWDECREEYGEEFAEKLKKRHEEGWTEFTIKDGVLKRYGGNVKKVIIPDGVTEIGEGAFCTARMHEVVIPPTVTKISERAFHSCPNLRRIEIPDGVTEIGNRAFIDCGYLRKVKLSKNLQHIGNSAFYCCSNLEEIEIPSTVKRIGDYAFAECIRLIAVSIDGAECTIGAHAFDGCDFICVYLGGHITEIGDCAFANGRVFKITIPATVKKMGKNVFCGCEQVFWIQCYAKSKPAGWHKDWNRNPESEGGKVRVIWDWAHTNGVIKYYDKSKFDMDGSVLKKYLSDDKEVIIPNGVTTVDDNCFENCAGLEKLTVPKSVFRFCETVFYKCKNIKTVIYEGTAEEWEEIEFYDRYSDLNELAEEIFAADGTKIKQ